MEALGPDTGAGRRVNVFTTWCDQASVCAREMARAVSPQRQPRENSHAIFERRFARGDGRRRHRFQTARGAALVPRDASARPAGGGAEIRCGARAVVPGSAGRDLGDGHVLDAGVLANGRPGAGRHRAGLCRAVRRRRSLSLGGPPASHPRRSADRNRGLDDPARHLRCPGHLWRLEPVRQAGNGSRLLRLDQGQLDFHGNRHHCRCCDRAALLPLSLHRLHHGVCVVVHVDGHRALDHRLADRQLGDLAPHLGGLRPRHHRAGGDRQHAAALRRFRVLALSVRRHDLLGRHYRVVLWHARRQGAVLRDELWFPAARGISGPPRLCGVRHHRHRVLSRRSRRQGVQGFDAVPVRAVADRRRHHRVRTVLSPPSSRHRRLGRAAFAGCAEAAAARQCSGVTAAAKTILALFRTRPRPHIPAMAKKPDSPKKSGKTPKSKAHRPDVQPIGPALAELLNPAINRGDAGMGSGTGLQPPPDNSWDRRAGGEAAAHRARASTRGTSEDVAKRDAATSGTSRASPSPNPLPQAGEGSRRLAPRADRTGVPGAAGNDSVNAPPASPLPLAGEGQGGGASTSPAFNEAQRGFDEAPQAHYGTAATIPTLDPELARQLGLPTAEDDEEALARPPRSKMEALGVKATADALENLIREGRPEFKGEDGSLKVWTPHRPPRPEKSEGGVRFVIKSEYEPKGDQPTAIAELVEGIKRNDRTQVLLGVTGSGKTYTMAKVIEATQRPAIILAPNKTLAAQLYGEFKNFFPDNAVEYFVSYYDYYQPEAYVPRTDTYIEKDSSINEQIDRMRHSATRALLERDDVIIVASVSCIYGIGSVETYTAMTFALKKNERIDQRQLIADLVALQYKRTQADFTRGTFRVRGDVIDIFPAHYEDRAWRVNLFGDVVENIEEFDPLTGHKQDDLEFIKIYANSHYVTPRPTLVQAIKSIKGELKLRLDQLNNQGRLLEAQRLEQRTTFDLEMMEATGSCAGIENYSRYLTGRRPGEPPPTLFEYIPENALLFVDERHQTVPQIGGLYRGDYPRKFTHAGYGCRVPSART